MKQKTNHHITILGIIVILLLVGFILFYFILKNTSTNNMVENYVNEKYNLNLELQKAEKYVDSYGITGGTYNYIFYFKDMDGFEYKAYLNTGYSDKINNENLQNINLDNTIK